MENKLYSNKNNIMDRWFSIWSFLIPITTIILIPNIKMTVVSVIFSCMSPFIIVSFFKEIRKKYIIDIMKFYYVYCIFILISQLSNIFLPITLDSLQLIPSNEESNITIFRYTMFSQTLYVFPGILTFYCAKYFYNEKWDKWIIYSGLFFVLYALYKWCYFLFMGEDGDFLTNKMYDEDGDIVGTTKLYQGLTIAGLTMQRVQGLTDEPSMYAFTILPYFIFALQKKANVFIILLIGISLLLSTSTTAYLGLIVYIGILLLFNKVKKKYIIFSLLGVVFVYIIFKDYIDDVIKIMLLEKLLNSQDNASGLERSLTMYNSFFYWCNLDVIHMLFGIGIGYIRSFDFFTSLLVNVGLLGLVVFSYFILKDIKLKKCSWNDVNNNAIILCLYICLMISVPEIWFPSFWLFIGIIRNQNTKYRY